MPKYRKKPVVIEAFQWVGDDSVYPEWGHEAIKDGVMWFTGTWTPKTALHIGTPEGVMTADMGDFIIRGIKGEIYPCKPEIFELTYEEVK